MTRTGDQPVIIFIHHPPFKVRLKRMDDISLLEPRHFIEAIAGRKQHPPHVLRPSAPAASRKLARHPGLDAARDQPSGALDFVIEGRIRGSHEPPAYGVVLLEEDQMIVHKHDYLDRTNTFLL